MHDLKMADHQNHKSWKCKTWKWQTKSHGMTNLRNPGAWKCSTWIAGLWRHHHLYLANERW